MWLTFLQNQLLNRSWAQLFHLQNGDNSTYVWGGHQNIYKYSLLKWKYLYKFRINTHIFTNLNAYILHNPSMSQHSVLYVITKGWQQQDMKWDLMTNLNLTFGDNLPNTSFCFCSSHNTLSSKLFTIYYTPAMVDTKPSEAQWPRIHL